ncbi:MAG: DUF2933 domain-containing protein [Acidobacteriota bacterium]
MTGHEEFRSNAWAQAHTPWVLAVFCCVVLFFLLTAYRASFFGVLPYLLLLLCPLLHLLRHGKHGGGHDGHIKSKDRETEEGP